MHSVSPVLLANGFNVMWAVSIPWALSLTCHIVLCSSGHNSPENQTGKYVYIHFLFMQVVGKNTGKGQQDGSEGLAAKPRDPHSIPRDHREGKNQVHKD